jgi:hypothetical protein
MLTTLSKLGSGKYGIQAEDRQAYMKAYWADPVNAERNRLLNLETRRQRRRDVVAQLGGKCVCCGYTGTALQVDHINDDGYVERKQDGQNFQRKMYLRVLAGDPGYQLLCANCNWEKRFARDE